MVVGDHLAYNGEARSTATLELMGGQVPLLDAVAATGTPFVLVLINGKPLVLPPSAEKASAVIECFNPGMLGGTAFAEVLFGEHNPSGKLTMTFPRHVGQLPVFYNRLRHQHGEDYADLSLEPAYEFGFGLSYTRFQYSKLRVLTPSLKEGESLRVEVQLKNAGERQGVEVAQVYVRDVVTSVTWPSRLLVGFERVSLEAGETRTLQFQIPFERLSLVDAFDQRVVEPGEFEILLGGSSRTQDLLVARFVVEGELSALARIPGVLAC